MKTKILLVAILTMALNSLAQFGGASSKFPYTDTLNQSDVIPIGTPGVANKNMAASNILSAALGASSTSGLTTLTGIVSSIGAIATNYPYLPVYNVELYGADHNPAGTNDHWAIQRAIDAATNSGGGIIFFPNGDYWVTNRTFHPKFLSEGAKSCITLWSNCAWVLQGEGAATIKLQDTGGSGGAGDFCLIGSGNWSTGPNPYDGGNPMATWRAADLIHLKNLSFDMMDRNYLYDMIEVHNGRTFFVENCKFLNNMNTTGDAVDVDGWNIVVQGCTYSNWNGSIFHPNNQAAGVAIFRDNFVTNCNTSWSLNTGFDASSSSTGFDIINCDFRNVGNVMKVEGGKTVRIRDTYFTFMTHAVVGTKTNLWIQGNLECSGSSFIASGTPNTIGAIVLDGANSTARITGSSFINLKALWTTNTLDLTFSGNLIVGADIPIRLGGTGRSHKFTDNQFGTDPATGNSVFGLVGAASAANNVLFSGNTCIGYSPVCAGTNWTVINNTLRASGTAYFHDGSFGNNRFINNMTLPFGNPANELRLGGPSNYVSGNVLNDVQILSGSATANYFCDNIIETGVFTYFGGSETTFRSGGAVLLNNFSRTGVPLFPSKTYLAANFTESAATMTSTALSLGVGAGRKYSFKLTLYVDDSVDAEGVKMDFDGGTATMTNFRQQATIFDTGLGVSTQTTAIATDITDATLTGEGSIECHGSFEVNVGGTFVIRAAQNTHTSGTLTVFRGSHLTLTEL